jgi:flagellar hook-basal body complex protein FliE
VHKQSDALAEAYAAGQDIEIHDLMIALQQTEVAFDLAVQVRNKIVEAYQEIMRMQI